MIRAVFFDLDDTLIDRAGAHRLYCIDLMERHADVFPGSRRGADLERLDAWGRDRRRFARSVASKFPGVGLAAAEVYRDHTFRLAEFVRADPSVDRMLADLGGRFRLAIVTNGSGKVQRAKLARLGGPPPRAFISGEWGTAKPEPGLFRLAINWVGCEPHEVLFVGDDPACDVAGASAVGMATCWVAAGRPYPRGLPAPDLTIDRVGELAGALA